MRTLVALLFGVTICLAVLSFCALPIAASVWVWTESPAAADACKQCAIIAGWSLVAVIPTALLADAMSRTGRG